MKTILGNSRRAILFLLLLLPLAGCHGGSGQLGMPGEGGVGGTSLGEMIPGAPIAQDPSVPGPSVLQAAICEAPAAPAGPTAAPLGPSTEGSAAKPAVCPSCNRLLPLDAGFVASVHPATMFKSTIFNMLVEAKVDEWLKKAEADVGGKLPYANPKEDVSTICFACKFKADAFGSSPTVSQASGPVTLDGSQTFTLSPDSGIQQVAQDKTFDSTGAMPSEGDRNPLDECGEAVVVAEGKLREGFSLKEFLKAAYKDDVGYNVNVLEEEEGLFRMKEPDTADSYQYVTLAAGRLIFGTKDYVLEAREAAKALADECPLKDVWAAIPETAVKAAGDAEAIQNFPKDDVASYFLTAPEIYKAVAGADFLDRIMVAAKGFTRRDLTSPFVESLLRFDYSQLTSDALQKIVDKVESMLMRPGLYWDDYLYEQNVSQQSVAVGEKLFFKVSAHADDLADPKITYSMWTLGQSMPSGVIFNGDTGEFSWTPAESAIGVGQGYANYTFSFSASADGYDPPKQNFAVSVNVYPSAPQ